MWPFRKKDEATEKPGPVKKPVETAVLTKEDVENRLLPVPNPENKTHLAAAFAAGNLIIHEWFNSHEQACLWTLEKSMWEYTSPPP